MEEANHRMLEVARESRGLTQKDFAARLGIAQATISKVENGQLATSGELVAQYSSALGYPPEFFYQDLGVRALPGTFFRKRKQAPMQIVKAVQAKMNIARLQLRKLLASVTIPEPRIQPVDVEDFDGNIEMIARDLRASWGLPPGPIENLTAAVESAGIIVIQCDFGSTKIDGLSYYDRSDELPPIILLRADLPGDRWRHTLAHECAHILSHHHRPVPPPDCEKEADRMAAAMLMPAVEIRGQLTRLTVDSLVQLKLRWRVSMQSIVVRAHDLGLLTQLQYQKLFRRMSQMGWRLKEPVEVPREQPSLMSEIVQFHLRDLQYSEAQLGQLVTLYSPDLRDWHPTVVGKPRLVSV